MEANAKDLRYEYEDDESIEVEVVDSSALALATEKASVDIQIATARAYPRSVTAAKREALELATMDEETAAGCFYVLPRSGKRIEGPSVRLAEIMAYAWGSLRADAEIVAEDRRSVTARGTAFDLEKNLAVRVQVTRRITNRRGERYNEDMINVAKSAAMAVAYRNALFKVIPHVYTQEVYQAARKASIGDASTMTQKRQAAVEWFGKAGVPEVKLYEILEVKGLDDIGEDELIVLRGLMTAIRDGETSVEQLLRGMEDSSEETASLNDALKKKAENGDSEPGAGQWHLDDCPSGYGLWADQTPSGGWYFPAKVKDPEQEPAETDLIAPKGEDKPRKMQKADALEAIRVYLGDENGSLL